VAIYSVNVRRLLPQLPPMPLLMLLLLFLMVLPRRALGSTEFDRMNLFVACDYVGKQLSVKIT